jgi:hypothetical protein
MNKEVSLAEIAAAFRRWPDRPEKPTGTDALNFYGWLQQHKPHLLQFKYPGDRWQAVHARLLYLALVSD